MPRDYSDHILCKQVLFMKHAKVTLNQGNDYMCFEQISSILDEEALKDVEVTFG